MYRFLILALCLPLLGGCQSTKRTKKGSSAGLASADYSFFFKSLSQGGSAEGILNRKEIRSEVIRLGQPVVYSIVPVHDGELYIKADSGLAGENALRCHITGYQLDKALASQGEKLELSAGRNYDLTITLDQALASTRGYDKASYNLLLSFYTAGYKKLEEGIQQDVEEVINNYEEFSNPKNSITVRASDQQIIILIKVWNRYNQEPSFTERDKIIDLISDIVRIKRGSRALRVNIHGDQYDVD